MNPFLAEYGPYEPGSSEDQEFQRGKIRGVTIPATRLLPAWATQVLPIGQDEQGNKFFSPPGLLTGPYAGIGELGPRGVNWAAGKLGYQTNLKPLPGAETLGKMYGNNARFALSNIPNVAPENETEQQVGDIAFAGSGMALPIPGAAFAGLPRAAQVAAHLAVPTGVGGGVAGTAIAAGLTGYENTQRDNLLKELGIDPNEARRAREAADFPDTPQVDLSQPDTSHTVAHPQTGAAATVPFPISLMSQAEAAPAPKQDQELPIPPIPPAVPPPAALPDKPPPGSKFDTLTEFGRPDIKIITPDFSSTGVTGTTMLEAGAAAAAAAAAAVVTMRYGGKILDPAIKLATGKGDQINTAANNARFNANLDAVDRGQVTAPPVGKPAAAVRGEAPLPGKAGSVMTNLAQSAYDKNRVLTEFTKETSPTTGVAKELEAQIGTINNSTPMMHSINEQMATGVNQANGGRQMPSLKGILQDVDNLSVKQQADLDEYLHMKHENNIRENKFKQAISSGAPLDDEVAFRHNYRNTPSETLRARITAAETDPAIVNIARRLWALQASHAQAGFEMGRLTQTGARRMVAEHPYHVPSTDIEGSVQDPLAFINTKALGWETPPAKALDAHVQYYAKLHAELRINQLQDTILRNADLYYKAHPTEARAVSQVLDQQGKPVTAENVPGRVITTYRDGVAYHWNVDNTNLYDAFKGGIAKTNMFLNTADSLRRAFQSGTTGVTATVIGQRPFAFINLNRNIAQIASDRFKGTSFGVADRSLQQATGGRLGSRLGVDPTQWIGSYNEAVRGSGAVTARAMADALRREGNPVTATLRQFKGDAWVNSWADWLEHKWVTSNAAARKAEGASGAGAAGVYERPTFNITRENKVAYNPMADVVPGVFHPDGIAMPYTRVRIPGTKGLVSAHINMRSWMRELHQEISDGANAYYWKGMRDDPNISQAQRVYNTRQVIGDPSVHGASKTAEWASHVVPWINPTIQDSVRMMRNLRDNPISFVLGTVHTLGMMATASLLSAMLGGNRHLNMLGKLMSTHDRASNMTFFHNPDNEYDYTQFSMPQRWRTIYPIILEAVSNGIGAFNLHQGEDAYNRIVHSLADLFNSHISHSGAIASRQGFEDTVGVGQIPAASVAAAVFGKRLADPVQQVIENVANGKPLNSGMILNADTPSRLPGRAAGSTYASNDDANWVHQVLRSIYGIAGDGLYNHLRNFYDRAEVTHDIANAFGGLVSDAGQTWRDNAPFGNMIWGNNVSMTKRNPIAEANKAVWDVINDPNYPTPKDVQLAGLTRPGGVAVNMSETPKINPDPRILEMVVTVNNYRQQIRFTVQPQLNDVDAQLRDIDNDPYFAATDKRNLHNTLTTKRNELEGQKSLLLENLNAQLSVLAGGKHVNAQTFKPARGMEQFHD